MAAYFPGVEHLTLSNSITSEIFDHSTLYECSIWLGPAGPIALVVILSLGDRPLLMVLGITVRAFVFAGPPNVMAPSGSFSFQIIMFFFLFKTCLGVVCSFQWVAFG